MREALHYLQDLIEYLIEDEQLDERVLRSMAVTVAPACRLAFAALATRQSMPAGRLDPQHRRALVAA